MSAPHFALQTAVMGALKAHAGVLSLVSASRIYDAVPARAIYPYVAYGPLISRAWSHGGTSGHDVAFTLTAYSRQPGFRESYDIGDECIKAVTEQPLSLSGHTLVLLRFESADYRRDADADTTRAQVGFRALLEPVEV